MDIEKYVPNSIKRLYKRPPARPTRKVEVVVGYHSFTTPAQIGAYEEALLDRMAYADGVARDMQVVEPRAGLRGLGGRRLCDTMRPAKGQEVLPFVDLGGQWEVFG